VIFIAIVEPRRNRKELIDRKADLLLYRGNEQVDRYGLLYTDTLVAACNGW
jgi:hypothetical protein